MKILNKEIWIKIKIKINNNKIWINSKMQRYLIINIIISNNNNKYQIEQINKKIMIYLI
jgi:hypothetical protein